MSDKHRIDIPNATPATPALGAAAIVVDTCVSLGADPFKVGKNSMGLELIRLWVRGEWTEAQFRHAVRNLLIINPSLRL